MGRDNGRGSFAPPPVGACYRGPGGARSNGARAGTCGEEKPSQARAAAAQETGSGAGGGRVWLQPPDPACGPVRRQIRRTRMRRLT